MERATAAKPLLLLLLLVPMLLIAAPTTMSHLDDETSLESTITMDDSGPWITNACAECCSCHHTRVNATFDGATLTLTLDHNHCHKLHAIILVEARGSFPTNLTGISVEGGVIEHYEIIGPITMPLRATCGSGDLSTSTEPMRGMHEPGYALLQPGEEAIVFVTLFPESDTVQVTLEYTVLYP